MLGACRQAMCLVDVLTTIRAASTKKPISRSELLRVTRLKSADVEDALEKLQGARLIRAQWTQGRRGMAYYRYVAVGAVPQKPKTTTWSGTILDLGVQESISWDIAEMVQEGVAKVGYAKEADVIRQLKNRRPPDGSAKYGANGVRAHIDDMIAWSYLVRLDKKEARKLLGGPRTAGPTPWLLVLGSAKVRLPGRVRARPWAQTRHASDIARGPFDGPTARDKRGSGGVIPDEYDDGVVEMDETPDPPRKPVTTA